MIRYARRAVELDPTSYVINTWAGNALFFARHYDEAIAQFRQAAAINEHASDVPWFLGEVFYHLGKHDEAVAEWMRQVALDGTSSEIIAADRRAYEQEGWRAYVRRYLSAGDGFVMRMITDRVKHWIAGNFSDEENPLFNRALEPGHSLVEFPQMDVIHGDPIDRRLALVRGNSFTFNMAKSVRWYLSTARAGLSGHTVRRPTQPAGHTDGGS